MVVRLNTNKSDYICRPSYQSLNTNESICIPNQNIIYGLSWNNVKSNISVRIERYGV